ncbi:MAG: alpha/beta hydrolase, partial [Oscillospiraceae bacterium]|nr:alpha/beta hydrolase [Oscillospiraceae bacterium]
MKKTGFWDALKTPKGRKIALAVLLIVVIACSSIASLLVTSGGKVVVREIRIDRRGGILSAELYTPKGISAEDSLPAVVVTHGGSCSNGVVSGIAQELARRGFVVLNVSAYGAGESENPLTDDYGSAPGDFASARGLNDAVDFVRTLEYVDKTRIGITGHSMGSIRTNAAADADCSWFTLNDILINILYNDFDVAISEEELYEDAYALAEAKLNAAELSHFQYMAAEQEEFYNTRIKAVLGLGTGPVCLTTYGTRDVEVAGFTVSRMLNTNLGLVIGKYDEELDQYSFLFDTELYNNAEGAAVYLGESCFFTEQPAVDGEIYLASNSGDGAYSKAIGTLAEFNYAEGSEITAGFDSRLTRFYTLPNETHSQNFLSIPTTSHIVKYFEAALGYNNGELSNPATTPIDSGNIVWLWREALNAVALLAMVGSLFVVAAMFLSKPFFAELVQAPAVPRIKSGNKSFWIISIFIALVGAV